MARRGKEMNQDKDDEGTEHHPWGTLEELLLACAVNRHGAKSWDSVATELQKRASSSASLHHYHHLRAAAAYSPPNCKQRYHDLLRRFSAADGDDALVDELKKLRVAELRREVERHDDSIELLELKVKRLEEEREQRTEETLETGGTDLPEELDNREPEENSRRERTGSGSGDDNENDNQSFDESNTTSSLKGENREQNGDEPVPVHEEVKAVEKCSLNLEEGTKENNENKVIDEVESPRTKKRRRSSGEDEAEGRKLVHAKEIASKSQPLIKILGMLRSHKSGSLFERRLRSQETDNYKKMIRRHMDLQTVQSRLDRGFYLSTTTNKNSHHKFFRDLLLLYTNAIIFFPTTSPHHSAALELRHLLTKHMPTIPSPPKPDPEPKQPDPVHHRTGRPVIKLRQPGNSPVPPKPDPGKKQPVIRPPGTNPVPQKSEPSKKEPVSLHPRPNKVGPKLERSEEKLHSNRGSMGNKAVEEKPSKKHIVKERPEWSRRSGRVGSGEKEKEKKKTPQKEVEEDGSNIEDGGETEKEKIKRRGERGRNNVSVKKGRPPSKSPVGRDVGRGKRGRREGGEPPPVLDSGRPRKRSKR